MLTLLLALAPFASEVSASSVRWLVAVPVPHLSDVRVRMRGLPPWVRS